MVRLRRLPMQIGSGLVALAMMPAIAQEPRPAAPADDQPPESEVIVVYGVARDFLERESASSLRFSADVADIPQSISVITDDLLELADVTDLGESAGIIAGVTYGGRNFARPQFNYRGFEGGVDGSVRTDTFQSNLYFLPDISLIEQIDAVKGPVSVAYGQIPPGGTINLVTKTPLADPYGRVRVSASSWNRLRGEFDFSTPLDPDGRHAVRVAGAFEDAGSFVDFARENTFAVGGSYRLEASDRLSVLVKGFHQARDAVYDVGGSVSAGSFAFPEVSRSRFYGQPWNESRFEFSNAGARATWRLTSDISANAIFDYQRVSRYNLFAALNGPLDAAGTANQVRREDAEGISDNYNYELNLTGEFELFGRDHSFYVGAIRFDGRDTDIDHERVTLPGRFSVFNPDYTKLLPPARLLSYRIGYSKSDSLSAQALLSFLPRVRLLLGGRVTDDTVDVPFYSCGTATTAAPCVLGTPKDVSVLTPIERLRVRAEAQEFVPIGGLVFEATDWLNLYANYARSFELQSGVTVSGDFIPPSEGEQQEAGVKLLLFSERLSVTAAAYRIVKSNIQQADEQNPGFSVVTGEVESEGYEFEIVGSPLPGWNVIGQYAYIDAVITRDRVLAGRRPQRVPEHSGSFYTTYELQSGPAAGLGFGVGVIHVGDRPATAANIFIQDAYTVFDTQLFYNFGDYEALFSVSNVGDENYRNVTFDGSPNGVLPGAPTSYRLSLARRF